MKTKIFIALISLTLLHCQLKSQSALVPVNSDYQHFIRRMEIRSGAFSTYFHSGVQPISRKDLGIYIDSFDVATYSLTSRDYANLEYLQLDNPDWTGAGMAKNRKPFLKYFYKKDAAMLSYQDSDFEIYANPIWGVSAARETFLDPVLANNRLLGTNNRGFELRGSISKKIGFYTYTTEHIQVAPIHLRQYVSQNRFFPTASLTKQLKPGQYSFFQTRGYLTFSPVKPIMLQFGQDRNFIGDGYRSMFLSDFGKDYLFLKMNTKVWRINYMNLFAQGIDFNQKKHDSILSDKKYMAMHHLSINISKNLNIGVSEYILFDRRDSLGRDMGFDPNYLNPVVFYRAVEHGLNSSDNAMIAGNFKWNFMKHFSLYGQLLLDELKVEEYLNNRGWWANKYAFQAGLHYIDAFGIKHLDLQYEFNRITPYTFTHFKRSQHHIHMNQPMGHPLGANFNENVMIVRFQPTKKMFITSTVIFAIKGLDSDTSVWGGDIIHRSYREAEHEYGNFTTQGVKQILSLVDVNASYMLFHNIFLEANIQYRYSNVDEAYKNKTVYKQNHAENWWFYLGLRLNIPRNTQFF